jgi:hypothetical protein
MHQQQHKRMHEKVSHFILMIVELMICPATDNFCGPYASLTVPNSYPLEVDLQIPVTIKFIRVVLGSSGYFNPMTVTYYFVPIQSHIITISSSIQANGTSRQTTLSPSGSVRPAAVFPVSVDNVLRIRVQGSQFSEFQVWGPASYIGDPNDFVLEDRPVVPRSSFSFSFIILHHYFFI